MDNQRMWNPEEPMVICPCAMDNLWNSIELKSLHLPSDGAVPSDERPNDESLSVNSQELKTTQRVAKS
jgi:hypothetical protein